MEESIKNAINSGAFCEITRNQKGIYQLKVIRYVSNNRDKKSVAISMFSFTKKREMLREIAKQKL